MVVPGDADQTATGIRAGRSGTETDTCVVAILDERAGKNRRYFRDVLTALPEVPVTHSLKDVERFIRAVKPEGYFLEGAA